LGISGPATSEAESSKARMGPSIGSDARPFSGGLAALGFACLAALSAEQADAEVRVDGGRDEIQVRVENDTVGHVLEALGHTVSLHCRSAAPLNKVIGGNFFGFPGTSSVPRSRRLRFRRPLKPAGRRDPGCRKKRRGAHPASGGGKLTAASDSAYGHRRGRA
jgi:hypothetical protein